MSAKQLKTSYGLVCVCVCVCACVCVCVMLAHTLVLAVLDKVIELERKKEEIGERGN